MLRFFLALSFTLLTLATLSAQDDALIDSLQQDLNSRSPDDTLRLYTLRHLWRANRKDPSKSADFARRQIREATSLNNLSRLAEAHKFLAISFGDIGRQDSVRYHNEIALQLYEEVGDNFQLGIINYNLGINMQENGEFAEAERMLAKADAAFSADSLYKQQAAVRKSMASLDRFQGRSESAIRNANRAYELAVLANDSSFMADAKQEIAFSYHDLKDYRTALKYHRENADFYLHDEDYYYAAVSLLNVATCRQSLGEFEAAREAGEQALAVAYQYEFKDLEIDILNVIGNIFWAEERYGAAEKSFERALPLFERVNYDRVKAEILVNLSGVQMQLGKYAEARINGETGIALSEEQGQLEQLHKGLGHLAIIERKTGNYKKAYEHMVDRQGYQDSLYQQELGARVAELTLKFEKERQDRIISEQQAELALLESKARADRLQRSRLIGGLLALLALLATGWYSYRQRLQLKEVEKKQLELEVKTHQKELSTHALQMAQKGHLLDQLASELQLIKGERPDDRKKLDVLLRDLGSEERIDQDWANFRNYFQGVHGNFEEQLKSVATTSLSPRELRLAALIKMQLNNQEIGSILSVTQDSLYKAKYRLRKKLPNAGEGELDEYLREMG